MGLDRYWEKRDFRKTPEPRGKVARPRGELRYYIQRHHASRLHYDFRLELDGTLKSWAIPKGPSLDPADKRLAMHVEDHPLDYGSFEGEIPAGQYGAGQVVLWDRGVWTPEGDPAAGYRKGRLKFRLEGEKLAGGWTLVRMARREGEKQDSWLLIKEDDEEAQSGKTANITELRPESVADTTPPRKRASAAKPAARKKPAASTKTATQGRSRKAAGHLQPQSATAAIKASLPDMLSPQLATLAPHAPDGDDWLSEIKFDGYRALCRIEGGKARIYTRAGNDWSDKWPAIARAAAHLPVSQAWLDGEVVALDDAGSVSFQALQNMARHGTAAKLAYYVFDLPYLDGIDLRDTPLLERKALLEALLEFAPEGGPLLYSAHIEGNAQQVFEHACMHGLEGIVVKRADGGYLSTRGRSWLKVKCMLRQEFVIAGYTDPGGSREAFGALLLGVFDDRGNLQYCGRVGTGFDQKLLKNISSRFKELQQAKPAFDKPPTGSEARGVHWLRPELVAEVSFAQWTQSGSVRHASFVGLRNDKPATDIRRERPLSERELEKIEHEAETAQSRDASLDKKAQAKKPASKSPKASSTGRHRHDHAEVAGIELSNPDKVLFADSGLTKLGLARYYEAVADHILPHLRDRPLTLVRCPNGGGAKCFFQKHVNDTVSEDIARIEVPESDGTGTYMMANDVSALINLVQMGVLELHTWGASARDLDKPDRIIFDLDPDEGLDWARVTEAALLVRGLLDEVGIRSFLKTTGGKGLHVVAPIRPEHDWDTIKQFTRDIASHLASTFPDRFTANMAKAKRHGRIFIDYLRNGLGATAIAAFSTRAKPTATVSATIAWEELEAGVRADTFTVANIGERLKALRQDPWQDYHKLRQRISARDLDLFRS